jgi:hypothetical protein
MVNGADEFGNSNHEAEEPCAEQPRSLYPESETPLADIDPLLPTLSLFQCLTSGKYMREKAAALRALALAERGVWTYGELDAVLWWISPSFKRYIVDQLRGSLMLYDEVSRTYSLNPEARIVCTILTALGGKDGNSSRVFIGHLLKIQELAEVESEGPRRWDVLRTAVAWLQSRQLELETAVRQGLVDAALEKAREINAVLDQVREFLSAQDAVLRTITGAVPPEVLNFLRDGHRTAAEVLNLINFVYRTLAQASHEFLTGHRNFTAQDVRTYAGRVSHKEIMDLVQGTLDHIPWNCPESADTVLPAAIAYVNVTRQSVPPLPSASSPEVTLISATHDDPACALAETIIAQIERSGTLEISELVVCSNWETSSSASRLLPEAHAVLVEREMFGKAGAPEMQTDGRLQKIDRGGVAAMTNARFRAANRTAKPTRAVLEECLPVAASGGRTV